VEGESARAPFPSGRFHNFIKWHIIFILKEKYKTRGNIMEAEKFWNMEKILAKHATAYCDWEGFASTEGLEAKVRSVLDEYDFETDVPEIRQVIGDLLMHYVYQARDQSGEEVEVGKIQDLYFVLHDFIKTKQWMKSGIKW